MINLPKFKIGNLEINLIQGGMGVGVSGSNLTSAVANQGGLGVIASVGLGVLNEYPGGYVQANCDAFRDEIRAARKKSNGAIGVNIMHVLTDYPDLVKVAVEEKVDAIISGAGMPTDLAGLVGDASIALIPIISYGRFTDTICNAWAESGRLPDAIIVEGPKAGGHLGYGRRKLENPEFVENALEKNVKQTLEKVQEYGNIPVIAAGGIYTGADIKLAQGWGAAGVQMATRFVTTRECDASDRFKQQYLKANKENIVLIDSPVGLPGRAISFDGDFLDKIRKGEKVDIECLLQCLTKCNPEKSPYCIADALVEAQRGNLDKGFVFAGTNAYKATPETCLDADGNFILVKTLMRHRIADEYNLAT